MSTTVEVIEPVRLGRISMRGFVPLRVEKGRIAYKEHFVAPAGHLCPEGKEVLLIFQDDHGIVLDRDGLFFVSPDALFTARVSSDTLFLVYSEEKHSEGWIVVWDIDFGFGGSFTWSCSENVRVLIEARKSKNCSKFLGGTAMPILFVPQFFPAVLRWRRRRSKYGIPAEWAAMWLPWEGVWHVSPLPKYR